jgi:hypothetical protein
MPAGRAMATPWPFLHVNVYTALLFRQHFETEETVRAVTLEHAWVRRGRGMRVWARAEVTVWASPMDRVHIPPRNR